MHSYNFFILILLPLGWNVITVFLLTLLLVKGKLTPLKFSLILVIGFSITVSTLLFIVINKTNSLEINALSFVSLIFLLNVVFGFPLVYWLSKKFLTIIINKWFSRINKKSN